MSLRLLDRDGAPAAEPDRAALEERLESGEPFWLDIEGGAESELALLYEVFSFHPLALQASARFGQRPKLVDYDEYAFLVLYGAAPPPDGDRLVEVHCFYAERYLVTVHRDDLPAPELLRERYGRGEARLDRPLVVLYRLMDTLADSFFPALADVDDRIDALMEAMFASPAEEQLQELVAMRRELAHVRKVVGPQRDLVGQLFGGVSTLPGTDREAERYFRDVFDHLLRVTDMIDGYRDLLSGAMDVYLSSVSNRLNLVVERLTVIATIALPLVVLTGFFGQNFGFLVRHVGSLAAFVALGLVLPVAAGGLLYLYLRRQRLL